MWIPGLPYYEERYRQRVLLNLQRRAKALGYVLQEVGTRAQAGVFLGKFSGPPSWDADGARRAVEVRVWVADQLRLGLTAGRAFRLTRDRPRSRLSGSTRAHLGNVGSLQHGNR